MNRETYLAIKKVATGWNHEVLLMRYMIQVLRADRLENTLRQAQAESRLTDERSIHGKG